VGGQRSVLVRRRRIDDNGNGREACDRHSLEVVGSGHMQLEIAGQELTVWVNVISDVQAQDKLRKFIHEFRQVFTGVGTINAIGHHVNLVDATTPYCAPLRRRAPREFSAENDLVQKLLNEGIPELTVSPWVTYNVLVPKSKGKHRLTTNFKLNSGTKPDSFPLENTSTMID